jgi:hypothetical protein
VLSSRSQQRLCTVASLTTMARIECDPRVRATSESLERARHCCDIALGATARARAGVAETRRLRAARRTWSILWSEYRHRPEAPMICCAYCARMRNQAGEWLCIHPQISEFLHRPSVVKLSHGYCRDCIARHFPD